MKKLFSFIFIALCAIMLIGCNSKGDYAANENASYKDGTQSGETSNIVIDSNRKLVYNVNITMDSKDIETKLQGLNSKAKELEGYSGESSIKYNSDSYAYGYMEFRIPTAKLDEFINYIINEQGYISKTVNIDDVTNTYSETEARIETLTASKQAYQASLESATNYYERIQILDKIEDIDTEIAALQKKKAILDNEIDYSTVKVEFQRDYSKVEEKTFFEEYGTYFANFFIFIGKAILYLLPVGIVGFGIFSAIYFPIKVKGKKKEKVLE